MRKKIFLTGTILILAALCCMNAYAAYSYGAYGKGIRKSQVSSWQGFQNSVGGTVNNALPWNWAKWAGK